MKKEMHYTAPSIREVCFNPGEKYLQTPFLEGSKEGEDETGGDVSDFDIDWSY